MSVTPPFSITPVLCSDGNHLKRGWMPLHDTVGVTVKMTQLLKRKEQVSSTCAKWCLLDNCVCVI